MEQTQAASSRRIATPATTGWRRAGGRFALAHVQRNFTALAERDDADSKIVGEGLLEQTTQLFELWHRVRDGTLERAAFLTRIEPVRERVGELLIEGAISAHPKTSRVCQNILKLEHSLWTFARTEGVEPTNNQAERALRRAVLWRRKSFGTQSEAGSRFADRILTVVTTLRQQGRGVLEFLAAAVRPADGEPALYQCQMIGVSDRSAPRPIEDGGN